MGGGRGILSDMILLVVLAEVKCIRDRPSDVGQVYAYAVVASCERI